MKKKILPLLIATFLISLVNTGFLTFLVVNQSDFNFGSKQIIISKDYDRGQSMEKALATGKPVIVWFYTDWCSYCQKFAPVFKKITKDKRIKDSFAIAYVNAENPANKVYMEEFEVEGYPTLYLVNGGKKELVSNLELFSEYAEESLKVRFLAFLE